MTMQQKKDLDQLFSSLADLNVQAPEASWDHIAQGLDRKRKKRRALWWWTYGAAASLFIGWGGATLWTSQHNPTQSGGTQTVVEQNTPNAKVPTSAQGSAQTTPDQTTQLTAASSTANTTSVGKSPLPISTLGFTQTPKASAVAPKLSTPNAQNSKPVVRLAVASTNHNSGPRKPLHPQAQSSLAPTQEQLIHAPLAVSTTAVEQQNQASNLKQVVQPTDGITKDNTAMTAYSQVATEVPQAAATLDSVLLPTASLMAEAEKQLQNQTKESKKATKAVPNSKWLVGPVFNPVVQNAFGHESPIDPKLTDNTKQFKSASTFGVQVQWAVGEHFGLRTGVHQAQMEFSTQNVYITEGFETTQLANLNANGLTFVQINGSAAAASALNKNGSSTGFSAHLNQRFRFVEIPIEGVYFWKQRKWLFQLSGGVSTYWMQENRMYLDSPSMQMNLGEASNANKWHYSGNIGAGIGWEALPKVVLGVEPYFKYQWNTYSSNTRFTPYTLGAYFGVKYRF